jgi:MFS family permease
MTIRTALFERLQQRVFYGWVILGVATLVLFASGPGQSHTFSVFVGPISADLGISATSIASAYAFATLIAALGLPYMGRFVDRFGPRLMLIGVAALLGVACIGFGAAAGVITLSLGFMALRFLGQGSIMLGSTNLVAQWFSARRGFAMSILMLGFAASIAIHPALAQGLIDRVGWREAWVWLGVMTWVLLLPLLWLVAHDRPEPLGLRPDGEKPETAEEQARGPRALAGITLAAAMRTPAFWIIAAGLFAPAMLITSLFFFQVSVFEAHGLDRTLAASMFGVSALSMAFAMPAVGWALDRSDPRYVFSASLVLLAVSLVGISLVTGPLTAAAYAICFGINTAANMTFFGYMWAQYFGRRYLGSIQGAGQTIGVVGASVGPLPLGIAFDLFGSYDGALRLLALLPLACAVLALFLKAPDLSAARDEET